MTRAASASPATSRSARRAKSPTADPPFALPKECWLPIPGFSAYAVSDLGRVKRIIGGRGTVKDRIINPTADAKGRLVFNARMFGQAVKQFKVSVAVMLTFVGRRPKGMDVAHLDGDLRHNALSNLTYATRKENIGHKVIHGTQPMGEQIHSALLTEGDVRWIRRQREISRCEMARRLGVARATVDHVVHRRTWKHL